MPGDNGSIASALITGKRDAISTPVNDAMYVSSLAHVLSISGYHMAVVAGSCLFYSRWPGTFLSMASRHPIKKWAAAVRWLRQRPSSAFRCRGCHSALVHHDRNRARWRDAGSPTLTFRTLAVVRSVLLFAPRRLFIRVPDVICGNAGTCRAYQYGLPLRANKDSSLGTRVALWGAREVFGLLLVSPVAALQRRPTRPTISTGWRHTEHWPIFCDAGRVRAGSCQWALSAAGDRHLHLMPRSGA